MSLTQEHDSQPDPVANGRPAVMDTLLDWLRRRDAFGQKKYGVRLQPFNNRSALQDAIEELQDLLLYLTQEWLERQESARLALELEDEMAVLRRQRDEALALVAELRSLIAREEAEEEERR